MNLAITIAARAPSASLVTRIAQRVAATQPARHLRRERDFGVGYGNSSGYASTRKYASNWAPPRFKFA